MGQAARRGSFEERRAQAIAAGRFPEVRRREQREARQARADIKRAYRDYIRKLLEQQAKIAHEHKIARIQGRRSAERGM